MSLSIQSSSSAFTAYPLTVPSELRLNQTNVLEMLSKVNFDIAQIEQPLREKVLQFCSTTTVLDLVGNQDPKYVKSVASFFKNVREISVAQATIDERYFRALSEFSSLNELRVFRCTITCFEAIQYLTAIPTLLSLFFSDCEGIDDSSLVHMEVFTNLQSLSFIACKTSDKESDGAGTKITDTGADYLTCLPELKELNLCRSGITDKTLASISTRLRNLTALSLSGCAQVTDKGVLVLSPIRTLRSLVVTEYVVSDDACEELSRRISGLKFTKSITV